MNRFMPSVALVMAALTACQASATTPTAKALAISDLPYGWAASPSSTVSSVTAPCSAITSDATKQLPSQTESDFQQSEDGPFLQDIVATGSAQQVQTLWTALQKAPTECAASTHLSTTPFPSYGDQSYALALTATRAGVTYSGDIVVVRKGKVFVEVVVFGVGGVSASLAQGLVGKAVGKVD